VKKLFIIIIIAVLTLSVKGQISLTSNSYSQDFNTLANSGTSSTIPSGWYFFETGTNANTTYTAGTGSDNAGDTYSFGLTLANDRALGGLRSSNLVPTFGAGFTNNTGGTITSITISYTGEMWRLGYAGRYDRLDFQYSTNATSLTDGTWTDVDALDFTSPDVNGSVGARDGNNNTYRTSISNTITGLSISNGSTFWIRWIDFDATNADDGLAVDDFSMTNDSPLPVELNSFTAFAGKSGVQLNWSTATEVNNYGFDILRQVIPQQVIPQQVILRQAQDDNGWEKIGFVQGHGNSNSPKDYTFVDANPPAGKVLYKLKQIDFDGAFEYSNVVEVNVETPQEFRLAQNYPNPFNPSTVISYQLPMDGNVTLKVYDMLGNEIATLVNQFQKAGSYNYQFSINNLQLSSGVYYYRLQSGNFIQTKKFILMK